MFVLAWPLAVPAQESTVYRSVEQMPRYPGGEAALMKYIKAHLNYPAGTDAEGSVIVQFVVKADGTVGEVKVARSLDRALDKEAVRIIKSLPKFAPGRHNGKPVAVWYTLPITFKPKEGAQKTNTYGFDAPQDTTVYRSVEQMPRYPGGEAALMKFLMENINLESIPDDGYGIGTYVIVQFIVDWTGHVKDVKVVRSAGDELDAEAVRVVKLLPRFIPGRHNGQAVSVWYTLPVHFDYNHLNSETY